MAFAVSRVTEFNGNRGDHTMQTGLSQDVRNHLDKCRASAIAAVEVYNRPGGQFRSAMYTILIIIAWQAFFHAYFFSRGGKPWYRRRVSTESEQEECYDKVDGEPKHWDLSKCLAEYFKGNNPPERKNLEFLIGLRNKIEHRHLPEFDRSLYGELQAALMNLEEYHSREFGEKYALEESLPISLQFSREISPEKDKAIETLAAGAQNVREYIETFRGGLRDEVRNSIGYSYSVYLMPRVANRPSAAAAAVEFLDWAKLDDEKRKELEKSIVLSKEKVVPVSNVDNLKPGAVVTLVASKLQFVFNMHHHTKAWRYYKVRPKGGSREPQRTIARYCIYDQAHRDYLYTEAWVEKLMRELSDKIKFREVTDQDPREKA